MSALYAGTAPQNINTHTLQGEGLQKGNKGNEGNKRNKGNEHKCMYGFCLEPTGLMLDLQDTCAFLLMHFNVLLIHLNAHHMRALSLP